MTPETGRKSEAGLVVCLHSPQRQLGHGSDCSSPRTRRPSERAPFRRTCRYRETPSPPRGLARRKGAHKHTHAGLGHCSRMTPGLAWRYQYLRWRRRCPKPNSPRGTKSSGRKMTWPAVTRNTSAATARPMASVRIIGLWGTDVCPPPQSSSAYGLGARSSAESASSLALGRSLPSDQYESRLPAFARPRLTM